MTTYTIISHIRDSTEVNQFIVDTLEEAIRQSIKHLPHHDGEDLDELDYAILSDIMSKIKKPTFSALHCKNTWLWLDGLELKNKITTYIIKTKED